MCDIQPRNSAFSLHDDVMALHFYVCEHLHDLTSIEIAKNPREREIQTFGRFGKLNYRTVQTYSHCRYWRFITAYYSKVMRVAHRTSIRWPSLLLNGSGLPPRTDSIRLRISLSPDEGILHHFCFAE